MSAFGFELRQAARRVFTWKQTGAIMIPAIGLALATIMFAVGWGYSSLSLPYKDAGQLVMVGYVPIDSPIIPSAFSSPESAPTLWVDMQPFFDWKERTDVFIDIAATKTFIRSLAGSNLIVKTPNGNVRLELSEVTSNFFDVLGMSFPGMQVWKTSGDIKTPIPLVLLNTTGVKNFGYTSIGQEFQTHDGDNIVVNGILPANFVPPNGDSGVNSFVPFEPKPGDKLVDQYTAQDGRTETLWINVDVIGRLAPGVTPQLAEQMLASTSPGERKDPFGGTKERLTVRPVTDIIAKSSKPVMWGAWALGALTLFLCAANLAGLLLTHCVYRLREYAMRSAFGAQFSDLLRMMLAELFLLSALAALIAAAIAHGAMPAIAESIPIKSAAFGRPTFDVETGTFLIIATLFVAILGGLFAAIALARNYYKGFSQGIFAVFHSHRLTRIFLTVSQTAIATILLSLSWLTVRGYIDLFSSDPVVDGGVRVVEVRASPSMSRQARSAFPIDVLESLRGGDPDARIGVMSGSMLTATPDYASVTLSDGTRLVPSFKIISPGLFRTLKVEILAGRDFTEQDKDDVLLINESLARRLGWPIRESVGKKFLSSTRIFSPVIGVVRDFPINALDGEIPPVVFTPLYRRQIGDTSGAGPIFSFVIHPDAMARAGNIERTILRFDPGAVVTRNAKWGDLLVDSVRGRTFATFSVSIFSIAAIAIIVIGIVSTITFIVARRTRDIAIQIAVGAPPTRVCWFVMKDMVMAGVIGALIGGIASWWAGKAVAHYIYNGEKYQNLTGLAIATVIMLAIIAAASLLPALRAIRIEPGRILNSE